MILIGILSLSYVIIFLLAPKDIADITVADTAYWRETENRLLLKTAYEYNKEEDIQGFPVNLGDWKSFDFKYSDFVYEMLKADILMSRGYTSGGNLVWMDIINSKAGESFHRQDICVKGAGWNIDNESIAEFRIADPPNPFTRLYANRLDISKKDQKQVMVYWFMFKRFGRNDSVTMIRLSSPVIHNETATFNSIKDFVESELFDAMYQRAKPENITMAEYIIRKYGKTGMAAITLGVVAPIGLVLLGIRRKS